MPQILLNDPNRIGGSSALNINDEAGVLGAEAAARLAMWATDINKMMAEIYDRLGYLIGNPIPFSTTVPLLGTCYMPPQSVFGPLTFTAGANPADYARCILRLTADGVNAPTFNGFALIGESAYVNVAGAVNILEFAAGGLQMGQDGAIGAPVTRPSIASIGVVHGTNPQLVITTGGGVALNPAAVPSESAFSLSTTQGAIISGVSVTSSSIVLQLQGAVALGDTVTVGYQVPALSSNNSPRAGSIVRDVNGNYLASFSGASATVS